jgi:hypothetical protein
MAHHSSDSSSVAEQRRVFLASTGAGFAWSMGEPFAIGDHAKQR